MQYQVFKTDGELVAWLDTETKDAILKRGYEIQEGEDLRIREVIEKGMQNPKVVAKFEKVTWCQYCAGRGCDPANVFTEPYAQEYDNIKIPKRATSGSAGYDFGFWNGIGEGELRRWPGRRGGEFQPLQSGTPAVCSW